MGYTNYDSWKTENPWDGQARLLGYKDEDDMIRHQEEKDEYQDEDQEN